MNYESEFQEKLIDALKLQYGIDDETVLYHYFALRYFIYREGKDIKRKQLTRGMMCFLCEELNLPAGDSIFYKDVEIRKEVAMENSLVNIMDSWIFENSIRNVVDDKGIEYAMHDYIKIQQKPIKRQAANKAKAYKQTNHFAWHWKYHALTVLNAAYGVQPKTPKRMEGVHYSEEHELWKRTMEEVIEAYVHSSDYIRKDVKTITEQDVENFLYTQLHLIEEGLVYVARQVRVIDGRIDILAKDRQGTYCIIELKVSDDKEVVWQCIYYPLQIKQKYGVAHVRMMTLAPSYSPSIKVSLESLGYVEMFKFIPSVQLGKIQNIQIDPMFTKTAA
ncbi:Holliday junction resolvase-like predicted endonuclease [Paenibacillus sp. 1182]|uniref:endonuclease NucS domain-containing protein n=1 Tax=Paenibacillus sp. 1182 TaxID=2806565 RepID=UPI001AE89343|nr:endonuclease NucS domain-containing protein [Paenibacillus sp. 1182]MBP1308669.1 Holliday junction resolvase-like predicted endonuclease [Paenibacillus sp. 1182]